MSLKFTDLRLVKFPGGGGQWVNYFIFRWVQAQVNVENIAALDDVDQCVFYYNHAVLLYHQRQYKTALAIMDKLIQFIEPMGKYGHITMMSHEGHGISNQKLKCLFSSLFRITITKTSKLRITVPLWGECMGHRWIPPQKPSGVESIFLSWHHAFSQWSTKLLVLSRSSATIVLMTQHKWLLVQEGFHLPMPFKCWGMIENAKKFSCFLTHYDLVTQYGDIDQCLKLMVAQSPLVTKNWAGPVKFDPGQVKIIMNYRRRKFSGHYWVIGNFSFKHW